MENEKDRGTDPAVPTWVGIALLIAYVAISVVVAVNNISAMICMTINIIFGILLAVVVVGWQKALLFYIVAFLAIALIENISVLTGIPFGVFEHFMPGPRIGNIPVVVCMGYFHFGILAWVSAELIIPGREMSRKGKRIVRPLLGMVIASALDAIQDPIGVLIDEMWVYPAGGGFFGVPLSNSFGWCVTVFVILLLWELILDSNLVGGKQGNSLAIKEQRFTQWHLYTVILTGLQILPLILCFLLGENVELTDVLGKTWQSADLYEVMALLALHSVCFVMVLGIVGYIQRINRKLM